MLTLSAVEKDRTAPLPAAPAHPQPSVENAPRIAHAINDFAVEALLHVCRLASASCRCSVGSLDPEEVRRQNIIHSLAPRAGWTQAAIEHHLSVLIGRCDIAVRSSPCVDARVTRHAHLLSDAHNCKLVSDADTLINELGSVGSFNDELAGQTPAFQYGVRRGWQGECDRLGQCFWRAIRTRLAVLDLVTKHVLLSRSGISGTHDFPDTIKETIHLLRKGVSTESKTTMPEDIKGRFWGLVFKCGALMSEAKSGLQAFELRVQQHVDARAGQGQQYFSYNFLGHDPVLAIAEFVGYQRIPHILLLSRAFSEDSNIKKLMPHLSVRCVPALFPHGMESIPGIGHCSVVSKYTQVHLVVDLAITGARRTGVNYSTARHETLSAGWSEEPVDRRTERRGRRLDEQERRLRKLEEEPTPSDRFRVRLSARKLFSSELQCKFTLVYADTHQEVNPGSRSAVICIPHSMARRANSMSTYTAREGVPYPAYTALNVMHLSTKHSNRLYKFRVTADGWYKGSRGARASAMTQKTLETYSIAFAVVSSKHAFKRKRVSSEQAR